MQTTLQSFSLTMYLIFHFLLLHFDLLLLTSYFLMISAHPIDLSLLCDNSEKYWKRSTVKLNSKLKLATGQEVARDQCV